jgi:hypothetical protein
MLDSMTMSAGFVRNGRLDVVATNPLAQALHAPMFDSPPPPSGAAPTSPLPLPQRGPVEPLAETTVVLRFRARGLFLSAVVLRVSARCERIMVSALPIQSVDVRRRDGS